WRWLPDDLGDMHVLVNLPSFELDVRLPAEGGGYRDALTMPVVIGMVNAWNWTTPVMSDTIESIVFHPSWFVPRSVQAGSLIPQARADSGTTLPMRGFDVYAGGAWVDPTMVDWDAALPGQYQFVQRPGRGNPMGRIKFVMPNDNAIIIHDTNNRVHLDRPVRTFSNGCILAGDAPAVEAAFARAERVVSLDLVNNRVTAVSMEARGAIGRYDRASGAFTLVTSAQNVHVNRDELADKVFGVAREKIRHLAYDVGGGFGMKNPLYPEYALVLFAARRLDRPVKWLCERGEAFLSDTHGRAQDSRVELALDRDGRFLALKVDTVGNIGAYVASIGPFTPTGGTVRTQGGAYRIPAVYFRARAVFTNTGPTEVYRGAGRPEACYQIERVVDLAARELGIDPAELRRRNLIRADELPYRTPIGIEIDSGDFETVLDLTLDLADWDGFGGRAAAARAAGHRGGRRRGIGVAFYLGLTGGKRFECVDLSFAADGSATLAVGAESAGTGHETVLPQIVSDRLGIPLDRIAHRQADTDLTPTGGGHGGSRGLEVVGTAVSVAAERVIEKARAVAGHLLEAAPADLEFADGRFTIAGTDRSVTMTEVIAASFDPALLPEGVPGGLDVALTHELNLLSYPNGCHVAEVEVDLETGAVALVRHTVVHDLGTIIHPLTVDGQVTGATTQGIGQALLEAIVYDENGQLLTGSLMDYAVPRAADLPRFRTAYYEGAPTANNPLGLKGAGEAGCGGAPPALVNAVVDALAEFGVRHIDMPLTPERVWRAIHARTPRRAEPEPA
ncbi:MAG: molybdopterin-dependent oxidoreductase, partial [Proteobacteria bacterium]|nr:molybdopterin-dependent oxidoreductase [Pseudomonadota bacterium]